MSQTSQLSQSPLFGGDIPWSPLDWTSSDDRVRGGSSYSSLTCSPLSATAVFSGNLDIKTLGGAGFASQRTTGENRHYDLSKYEGLVLDIEKSDGKKYTLILKDELLPKSPNGREQSTVSWEYDFTVDNGDVEKGGKGKVFVKWSEFKPTYRGKEKKDAKLLDLRSVKRVSLMMRSFFGTQQGDFSLSINSISAAGKVTGSDSPACSERYRDDPNEQDIPWNTANSKAKQNQQDLIQDPNNHHQGWFGWLFSLCSVKSR